MLDPFHRYTDRLLLYTILVIESLPALVTFEFSEVEVSRIK
jgi:hypothetical protein